MVSEVSTVAPDNDFVENEYHKTEIIDNGLNFVIISFGNKLITCRKEDVNIPNLLKLWIQHVKKIS